jgi:hypothetical protein
MLCLRRNANGGPYSMPVRLRLTSVLGDSVYDTLPDWGGGQVGGILGPTWKFCQPHAAVALALSALHTEELLAT